MLLLWHFLGTSLVSKPPLPGCCEHKIMQKQNQNDSFRALKAFPTEIYNSQNLLFLIKKNKKNSAGLHLKGTKKQSGGEAKMRIIVAAVSNKFSLLLLPCCWSLKNLFIISWKLEKNLLSCIFEPLSRLNSFIIIIKSHHQVKESVKSGNFRMVWDKKDVKTHPVPTWTLFQVASSPGLGHFQGWSSHKFSGNFLPGKDIFSQNPIYIFFPSAFMKQKKRNIPSGSCWNQLLLLESHLGKKIP